MALKGIRVLEFAGLAPAPFCGMIFADFGATVIRIDKAKRGIEQEVDCLGNGKISVGVDIKHPEGIKIIKELSRTADVLIEPFRGGVMEKLGLGPADLMEDNKRLIYARLTGYGQTGPLSHKAGHDINFISLSGVLSMFGWEGNKPSPPVNFAADFGGGGLMCALGITMALIERSRSGLGQVVDSSMLQGSAYLGSWLFRSRFLPIWGSETGQNVLDGGSERYNTYKTSDGKYIGVGALEPQFFSNLLKGLSLSEEELDHCRDGRRAAIQREFNKHPRDYWVEVFKKLDACVTPVLSPEESLGRFTTSAEGCRTPLPDPQLSRTPPVSVADKPRPSPSHQVLLELGYTLHQLQDMAERGVIAPLPLSKL